MLLAEGVVLIQKIMTMALDTAPLFEPYGTWFFLILCTQTSFFRSLRVDFLRMSLVTWWLMAEIGVWFLLWLWTTFGDIETKESLIIIPCYSWLILQIRFCSRLMLSQWVCSANRVWFLRLLILWLALAFSGSLLQQISSNWTVIQLFIQLRESQQLEESFVITLDWFYSPSLRTLVAVLFWQPNFGQFFLACSLLGVVDSRSS